MQNWQFRDVASGQIACQMTWLAGTSDVEIAGGEGWTVWAQRGLTQLTEAWGHTGETGILGNMASC